MDQITLKILFKIVTLFTPPKFVCPGFCQIWGGIWPRMQTRTRVKTSNTIYLTTEASNTEKQNFKSSGCARRPNLMWHEANNALLRWGCQEAEYRARLSGGTWANYWLGTGESGRLTVKTLRVNEKWQRECIRGGPSLFGVLGEQPATTPLWRCGHAPPSHID